MSVLVVAAHPDDEVLGCGGTILKHVEAGTTVDVAILGEGITSRYENREDADPQAIEKLLEQSRRVAEFLGVNELYQYQLPDNRFDRLDLLDVVKKVESVLAESLPRRVYTHQAGDLNIDHRMTHRAVVTATRPLRDSPVQEVIGFETPSATEWNFNENSDFSPDLFTDVSDTLSRKLDALKHYESEVHDFPHPRSEKALRSLAHYRGSTAGYQAAEAFEVIRIRRGDEFFKK